ncbi:MAG: adenylosuccinate lyase [Acidobacteriaceae bacterium]|jgi:adenylosuccinate lyase
MIARYTRPAMGRIWSDENKYRCWLAVEVAASQALARFGLVPQSAADAIRDRGNFTVARIDEIEAEVRHDVIAFTTTVAEHIADPESSRWLHYGLTSTDVVDTAQSLQLREASAIIRADIVALSKTLKKRALEFKHTPIIGRTHGVHAEPTTFGLKLLLWYSEMQRNLTRFDAAAEDLRVGKLSGAVGTFGHLKPEHEEAICAELGLRPVAVATQIVQRDRHAAYIAALAILCSTLDKIATEVRHLQRTEVREAEEFFSEKQKGSSAMPHKRNPITSEQISGLARVVRANAQVAFEDIALWHERDISHSSAERVILPDSTILADYLLAKTENLIANLLVYPERMLRNLESTGGLVFSGQLLLDLAESGLSREDAYRLVQSHAMRAWKEGLTFRDEIARDPAITSRLTTAQLAAAFDYHRQLANVDAIFTRVLGS